uniref:Uncharacterized protein n=1 Tax=Panagrolaimus sp. ES5 TaxID=591445 RepID=A0AC34F5C9_9BILA
MSSNINHKKDDPLNTTITSDVISVNPSEEKQQLLDKLTTAMKPFFYDCGFFGTPLSNSTPDISHESTASEEHEPQKKPAAEFTDVSRILDWESAANAAVDSNLYDSQYNYDDKYNFMSDLQTKSEMLPPEKCILPDAASSLLKELQIYDDHCLFIFNNESCFSLKKEKSVTYLMKLKAGPTFTVNSKVSTKGYMYLLRCVSSLGKVFYDKCFEVCETDNF